jgi:hypothetical protein
MSAGLHADRFLSGGGGRRLQSFPGKMRVAVTPWM